MTTTQILPIPPTAMLREVHDRIRELFTRYNTLGPDASWARNGLFLVIQEMLLAHMEIEESLFYPLVQGIKSDLSVSVVKKALMDHQQVKDLLEDLRRLSTENKALDPQMGELQECVFSHLTLEEGDVFPHARAMSPGALGKLSAEMEKLRDRLRDTR